jgi:ABC-2 type transport system ATP-binding protein
MVVINDLCFGYKKNLVLNQLSLRFRKGNVYGLLGQNGTGKSTLLRNISGLLAPRSGSVAVDGHKPSDREPAFLSDVYMVPEEFYLPDVLVTQFVSHQAAFYPQFNREQFDGYLALFGIPGRSTLQKMSYGQKKKVLISFALASGARLLLMDEPTNGLDIMSKSQFRKVLAEALDENRCIIISTHQVKDLENLIDRVTVIDDGRILFDEDVAEITRKVSFGYAAGDDDLSAAVYAESSLRGNAIVTPNHRGEESKLDLELLYKAIITNGTGVSRLFQA